EGGAILGNHPHGQVGVSDFSIRSEYRAVEFHYTALRSDLAKVGPGARALIADTMARPACAFAFEDRLAPSRIPRGKGCGSGGRQCHGPEVSHNRLRIRLVDIRERDHPGSR